MEPQEQRPAVKFSNIKRWLGEVQALPRSGITRKTAAKPTTSSPLKPIDEDDVSTVPWDTDATVKTYVNSVNCDPLSKCIEGYDSFADLTLDWWKGRLETKKFVEITAKTFAPKPGLLQDLNLLLRLDPVHASRLFLSPHESELSAVVLEESDGSQILAVSPAAKSRPSVITSSKDVQDILASEDPWKTLVNVDPIWVPSVMQLFQIELETASDSDYSRKCMKYLRSLVKKHRALPPSFLLNNIAREGTNPVWGGGFADIWKGRIGSQPVCLKVLRIFMEHEDKEKLIHAFCHEALVWKQFRHPNVLPFLGVSTELFAPSFCLVSPWLSNGDVIAFLKKNPDHDHLTVFREIAEGLDYLHSYNPPIIHGDIRGANILITDDFRCCLADFGLAVVTETHGLTPTTGALRGSTRWLAPEIISPAQFPKCPKSARDIYAFGCTVLEIITGRPPYSQHKMDGAVIHDVMTGRRPARPTDVWCPDKIWDLIESCWAEDGHSRPPACSIPRFLKGVARDLAHASISPAQLPLLRLTPRRQLRPRRSVFSLSAYDGGSEYTTSSNSSRSATASTDSVNENSSPPDSLSGSLRQSNKRGRVLNGNKATGIPLIVVSPPTDSDEELDSDPEVGDAVVEQAKTVTIVVEETKASVAYTLGDCIVGTSSSTKVYHATDTTTGELVAIKEIHLGGLSVANSIRLMKEIRSFAQLSHPHIARYYGLTREDAIIYIAMESGERYSLRHLLQDSGPVLPELASSYIYQALHGLAFLHSRSVIHFDLRAANILITEDSDIKLAEFGIPFDWLPDRTGRKDGMGTRPNWMAPEVINLEGPSQKSDIWSLGCTVIEIVTGEPPYDHLGDGLSVMFHIVEDEMPPIPPDCPKQLRDFLVQCFRRNPEERPSAENLLDHPWMKTGYLVYTLQRESTITGKSRRLSLVMSIAELEAELSGQDMQLLLEHVEVDSGHEFVKTTFSRPLACTVCGLVIPTASICCRNCPLIAHPSCATSLTDSVCDGAGNVPTSDSH